MEDRYSCNQWSRTGLGHIQPQALLWTDWNGDHLIQNIINIDIASTDIININIASKEITDINCASIAELDIAIKLGISLLEYPNISWINIDVLYTWT